MDISVLIITHNSETQIDSCLDSLARYTHVDHEVIIVDNASIDATLEAATSFYQVHVIENTENSGFAIAVNQAAQSAAGRYLLLLNPDTVVHEDTVDRLTAFMDSHPTVGICAPRVLDTAGRIRHNCFAFETPWSFFWFGVGVGPLVRVRNWMLCRSTWDIAADVPQVVEAVTGAAMLVRQEIFEALGGLDERFFMYCEDGDFCLRAQQAGWQTMLVPSAVITHIGGTSAPQDAPMLNGMIGRYLLQSRFSYTHKYWGRCAAWLLRWAYAVAGALLWLTGHLFPSTGAGGKLKAHGRLLWRTPLPSIALITQVDKVANIEES